MFNSASLSLNRIFYYCGENSLIYVSSFAKLVETDKSSIRLDEDSIIEDLSFKDSLDFDCFILGELQL